MDNREFAKLLLCEATELLNEGAVKSDHNRKQKHNKLIADFEKSIERAREMGVPEDKILKNKEEIDKFFMGTKKSQNESIAILLTEAALLLNEGAVKSDHNRKQKHNKLIADFEKSIERAREMGVPEDKILKNKEEIDKFFMGTKKSQ